MAFVTAGDEQLNGGEHGHGTLTLPWLASTGPQGHDLTGAKLYSTDGTYLGTISRDAHDTNSIANEYGEYGSRYSASSILNDDGAYDGLYSPLSPLNVYSSTPPKIQVSERLVGFLTVSPYISPRIDARALVNWIKS